MNLLVTRRQVVFHWSLSFCRLQHFASINIIISILLYYFYYYYYIIISVILLLLLL